MSLSSPLLISTESPESQAARPVRLVRAGSALGHEAAWAAANGFTGQAGRLLVCPDAGGGVASALFGLGRDGFDPMSLRGLAARLPEGVWRLEGEDIEGEQGEQAALAFCLGRYVFDRYKAAEQAPDTVRLVVPQGVDMARVSEMARACALVREMVDTPAADMGPLQIETLAREIAEESGAALTVTVGQALIEAGYPAIHAVGRAATEARGPRLVEMAWGMEAADRPLLALVGKGVVFDTGGLDLKPAAGMRYMKKDMGGAAHVLGLARLVMRLKLKVRLVVLMPVVENAVSGEAFRPGDILSSRKGLTIEIGNTDAEGRLILADALTRAGEHAPDLTLDFATLTGAARIALGPELPPFYTADETLAAELSASATRVNDPLWRMPLWPGYRAALDSGIADVRNDSAAWAQAGSVTAALFLQKFAPETGVWAHLDVFAWNPRGRPGWPEGAEAQGLRAAFDMLERRFGRR